MPEAQGAGHSVAQEAAASGKRAKGKADYTRLRGRKLQRLRMDVWRASPACKACERIVGPDQFELDHIKPLHKGGTDDWDNLQVLCIECHKAKTAKENGSSQPNFDSAGRVVW